MAAQDSTESGLLKLNELKQISKLLDETEYRRFKDSLNAVETAHYNNLINMFISERKEWELLKLSLLNQMSESIPKWYERPLFVSGGTTLLLFTIYYLLK